MQARHAMSAISFSTVFGRRMFAIAAIVLVSACASLRPSPFVAEKIVTQPDVVVRTAEAYHSGNPALDAMMRSALLNTGTQIAEMDDGTAYVKTGDIPAEWLRDSTVQVEATYLQFAHDAQVRTLFRAVFQRQAKMLLKIIS